MVPESVWNTLAGGCIGFFSGLGIWVIRDWIASRRRRRFLVDAIDSAARSCSVPAISSAFRGRASEFNPAEQFLPMFWRDLPLLGTYTQMIVVSFFWMIAMAAKSVPSKTQLETLEEMRQSLMRLLELERRGKRQNVKP